MQWNVTTLEEFNTVAKEILGSLESSSSQATVLCLHGDLGAGKTTMTQIIARELGVTENLQSPTFVIRKAYNTSSHIFTKLIHIDAYRLGPDDNIKVLNFHDDFLSPQTLVMIEWPEMIEQSIPVDALHVYIEYAGEGRRIQLEK